MDKFIIEYTSKVNGELKITFHENISVTDENRLDVMNVYTEHISTKKSEAKVFFSKEEAQKVCSMFSGIFHNGKVIKK